MRCARCDLARGLDARCRCRSYCREKNLGSATTRIPFHAVALPHTSQPRHRSRRLGRVEIQELPAQDKGDFKNGPDPGLSDAQAEFVGIGAGWFGEAGKPGWSSWLESALHSMATIADSRHGPLEGGGRKLDKMNGMSEMMAMTWIVTSALFFLNGVEAAV